MSDTLTPGSPVHTPDGPGVIESIDGEGCYVAFPTGISVWFHALTLRDAVERPPSEHEIVLAERKRIAEWLQEQMKPLIATGNREAAQVLRSVLKRVVEGA